MPPEKATGAKAAPLLFTLQALMRSLPEVIVAGVPSVQRAVISQDTKDGRPRWVPGSYHRTGSHPFLLLMLL